MSSLRLALKQSLEETGGATIGASSSSSNSSSGSNDSSSEDHSPHASPNRDDARGHHHHHHHHHRNNSSNNNNNNDHHHHSQPSHSQQHGGPPASVKRGPGRPRKHPLPGQQQHQPTSSTKPASDHHPVRRKRGRPPRSKQPPSMMTTAHHQQQQSHDQHNDDDDFSSENEFSHEEEEEEEEEEDSAEEEEFEGDGESQEGGDKEHDDEEEEEDDDDGEEEGEDEEEQGTRSRSRHNHQHRRRQQHQRQHQRSSAATKIQSHWKKKKHDGPDAVGAGRPQQQQQQHPKSVGHASAGTHSTQNPSSSHNKRQSQSPEPPSSSFVEPRDHHHDTSSSHHQQQQHFSTTSRSSPTHVSRKSPTSLTKSAATAAASMQAAAEPTKRVQREEDESNTRDKNASSAPSTTKSKTVPPPMPEVLEWTRNLPIKRARKHVSQGLRVKVRFSTKVKRDGKVVRKKKWFGGRVSAVSKKGSKIRIKYDDGTTEETKFPDKDVVVDDTSNGQHNASVGGAAGKFIPPSAQHNDGDSHSHNSHLNDDHVEMEQSPTSHRLVHHQHYHQGQKETAEQWEQQQQQGGLKSVGPHERRPSTGLGENDKPQHHTTLESSSSLTADASNRKQPSPMVVLANAASASDAAAVHACSSMEQSDTPSATKIKRKRGRPPKHRPPLPSAEEEGGATPGGDSLAPVRDHYESMTAIGRDHSGSHDSEEASSINNNNNRTGMYSSAGDADMKQQQLQHSELQQQYRHKHQHSREDMATARADAFAVAEPGDRGTDVQLASPSNNKPTLTIRLPKLKQNVDRSEPTAEIAAMQLVDQQQPAADAGLDEGAVGREEKPLVDRPRKKRPASAEPNDSSEPPLKRLHIHISKSKKGGGTTESTEKHQHGTPPPHDGKSSTTYMGGGGDEPASPMPMRAKQPYSSPSSARKLKRKRLEAAENGPALPITTRVVKSAAENREGMDAASFPGANEFGSNDKKEGVVGSKNSAFDKKDGLSVKIPQAEDGGQLLETNKAATLTPRGGRGKKSAAAIAAAAAAADELALSIRSGRRAAQQANERITAKPDASDKEQLGKKKKKRGKHPEGGDTGEDAAHHNSNINPEGGTGEFQWVQCDGCGKWRIIPSVVVDTLPAQWFCADNQWDPKRATCDAPEQTAKQIAKEKKRKKRQRLLMEKAAAEEAAAAAGEIPSAQPEAAAAAAATDRERPKSPPKGKEDSATTVAEESQSTNNKVARRPSPADSLQSESGVTSDTNKQEKKPSATVKKGKGQVDVLSAPEEAAPPTTEPKRGRGRPRRKPASDSNGPTPPTPGGKDGGDEGDNLEWVQCEKCDKWRKLPPHISADELPDVWYCQMNTWNPKSASCEAPEDKAEGLQDIFNNGGSGAVKLSYRNLIFGSNGRKTGRPISERTRAAESLFATVSDDNEAPPTVMYASSSAFQSRSKAHQQCGENEQPSILDIMTQSHLWKELSGTTDGTSDMQMPLYSFDMLPSKHKEAMKDLALNCVATRTLTGDEVHAEIQARNWEDNVPQGWTAVRGYCTVNILVMALCQLVKEGVLECVQKKVITADGLQDWDLAYRRAKSYSQAILPFASRGDCGPELSMDDGKPRCTKFSKPWKRHQN